ncbi:tRNA (guanine-N(7)-)-methyltransferase [Moraxella ovis]|uniref:tRNA (guanine(46)-N(7))-methyltransferase n=3 Tax=Moraxella ovis TaxID=29433 RepID=A0A378PJV8_9GAMM|nr:tRNA (guanine-N(7)-)-methyltransferase [Moraxella ovis]
MNLSDRFGIIIEYFLLKAMTMSDLSHRFNRLFRTDAISPPKNVEPLDVSNAPLYLEIGAGKGKHALLFAKQNPDRHLIAIERTSEKFEAFDKLVKAENLPNLSAVHADAIAYTAHHIAPNSLDGAFILYPNPEPANKNQRWLNMPFFEFLVSRLKPGATITLASNIGEYIDEAQQLLDEVWLLPYERFEIDAESARTHFEIKYLARGEKCQELIILKPNYYQTRFDQIDDPKE